MSIDVHLSPSQGEFYLSEDRVTALVTGYGGGKTFANFYKCLTTAATYKSIPQGYFAPTYPLIRDIFFPTATAFCAEHGLICTINKQDKIVQIEDYAPIMCRTMDDPDRIIGFEIGDAHIDELDTMREHHAKDAFNRILARLRAKYPDGRQNRAHVTTTPEGFRAVYKLFKQDPKPGYRLIQGSTIENKANLPEGYIQSLYDSYDPAAVEAYVNGQFVNLETGQVYRSYKRFECNTNEEVRFNEPLLIGMDFNVQRGCAVVYVTRYTDKGVEQLHAVDEIHNAYDTPAQISILKERYPGHAMTITPDASGDNRKSSNATETDFTQLKSAGFRIQVNNRNPLIKERVQSMNTCFSKGTVKVNAAKCPKFADALEQQSYDKNGQPDKTPPNYDDIVDAGGYPVCYKFPVKRNSSSSATTIGMY